NRNKKHAAEATISTVAGGPTAAQDGDRTNLFRLTRQLLPYLLTTSFLGGLWSKDTQPVSCSFGAITGRLILR
ncbi:MAG TPA: hypothetical protein VE866_17865, partial [Candidatus Binatia bacterium]|nr:hypothetical protein [Candidatus Binatia bacterium]